MSKQLPGRRNNIRVEKLLILLDESVRKRRKHNCKRDVVETRRVNYLPVVEICSALPFVYLLSSSPRLTLLPQSLLSVCFITFLHPHSSRSLVLVASLPKQPGKCVSPSPSAPRRAELLIFASSTQSISHLENLHYTNGTASIDQ